MEIKPVAYFRSPLTSKFGIPRQSGVVPSLKGEIVFTSDFRDGEAIRGLEDFDYLWIIWGFSKNAGAGKHPTVRPPRLGGNTRMGVFATRSPFRPNNLGLSSVKIERISKGKDGCPIIEVRGADLMDGTPIYDIKPYLPTYDCHTDARGGFTDSNQWSPLETVIPDDILATIPKEQADTIRALLREDPRPHYHNDPQRIYGMPFDGKDIRFRVEGGKAIVVEIIIQN